MASNNDDMMDIRFGYEVQLNTFETVCLFLGHRVKKRDKNSDSIHEYCMVSASERYPLDPKKGEVYGVFLEGSKRWTRGKLKEIYYHVNVTKYKFFLIDHGYEVTITKQFMVKLNSYTDYPPMCLRIGLYGVLPDVTLCKKCIYYLTELLHKGPIYLKEKLTINKTVFGRIVIVPFDKSEPIDLAVALLNKGLVKECDNFDTDVIQFFKQFNGLKDDLILENQTSDKLSESKDDKPMICVTKQKITKNENEKKFKRAEDNLMDKSYLSESSHNRSQHDTGYSSDDDPNKSPFVHEDVIFVPAGFHHQPKKLEKGHSKKQEIHFPRNYYHIRNQEKENSHRQNKRLSRLSERRQVPSTSSDYLSRKQEIVQERKIDQPTEARQPQYPEIKGDCSEKSSVKQVTWGNTIIQENKYTKPETKPTRAFNLNFKSARRSLDENESSSCQISSAQGHSSQTIQQFLEKNRDDVTMRSDSVLSDNDDKCSKHYSKFSTSSIKQEAGLALENTKSVKENTHFKANTTEVYQTKSNITSESSSCSNVSKEIKQLTSEISNSSSSINVMETDEYPFEMQGKQPSTSKLLSGDNNTITETTGTSALTKKQQLKLKYKNDYKPIQDNSQTDQPSGVNYKQEAEGVSVDMKSELGCVVNKEYQHSRNSQSRELSNISSKDDQNTRTASIQTNSSSNNSCISQLTKKQLLRQKHKNNINASKILQNPLGTNKCGLVEIGLEHSVSIESRNKDNAVPTICESFNSDSSISSNISAISLNSSDICNTSNLRTFVEEVNKSNNNQKNSLNLSGVGSGKNVKLTKRQMLKLKYKNELDSTTLNVVGVKENAQLHSPENIMIDPKSVAQNNNLTIIQGAQQDSEHCIEKGAVSMENSDGKQTSYTDSHSFSISDSGFDMSSKVYSVEEERRKKLSDFMAPSREIEDSESSYSAEVTYPVTRLRNKVNSTAAVLVHSCDGRTISPVYTLSESNLDPIIVKRLEQLYLREMSRIQRYTYSAICSRENVAMICGPKSGKTAAYTVPLASNLLDPEFYLQLPKGSGPRVIVVVPYWQSGYTAAGLFHDLSSELKVIHTYGGGAELEKRVELLNGCDVLVSTPKCLLRLLDCGATDLRRLCHIVLDDTDILLDKFNHELKMLILHTNNMQKDRERKKLNLGVQVVISSSKWTVPLEQLVTVILADPIVCIGSQLEACVYAGLKPKAVFVDSSKKMEKLVEILKQVEGKKRAVVVCKNKADVKIVYSLLLDLGVKNVIGAHEDLTSVNISEMPNFWYKDVENINNIWDQSISPPILVMSDEVLDESCINNAQVLIHYNMPGSLKTFGLRFACLMTNHRNVLKKETYQKKCEVFILIDEENDLELPGLMSFMTRLGTVLPDSVQVALEKISDLQQEKKMSELLCEDLKQFGQCFNVQNCTFRHILSKERDLVEDVPKKGQVKILVQHVHNACHFSARLLEHAQTSDNWKKLPNEMMVLSVKLNNYYSIMNNKKLHGQASVGDMVTVESSFEVFHRAVVLRVTRLNNKNEAEAVNIRLIDNGEYKYNVRVVHLYNLPDELKSYPPGVVDVYLCNLTPKDRDISWSEAMNKWVEAQFLKARRDSPNGYLCGKILLSFGHNIWLEPVQYKEHLPLVNTTVTLFSLRKDLLSSNNAVDNPDHIINLRKLCQKAGIEVQQEVKTKKKPVLPKPDWAWLPYDVNKEVFVVSVPFPSVIFVRLSYFIDKLQELEKEIQVFVKNQGNSEFISLLDIGDICLGRSTEGDNWSRAIVNSKPNENQVELFFVDYGDLVTVLWDGVAPISSEHITKLPFQAIECCLAGIQFAKTDSSDWEDDVIYEIYNLTRNSNEEAVNLLVKVVGVEPVGMMSNGRRYKVILSDINNQHVIINKQLAIAGFAVLLDEDKHLFEERTDMKVANNLVIDSDAEGVSAQDTQITTVVHYPDNQCDVLLSQDFNLDETNAADEKEKFILQFLKDVQSGRFEVGSFYSDEPSDNDADISENYSEGSVLSFPQSSGSCLRPEETLPNSNRKYPFGSEDKESISSQSIKSSSLLSNNSEQEKSRIHLPQKKNHGSLSLNEKSDETIEIINQQYLENFPSTVQSTPNFESNNADNRNRRTIDSEERDEIRNEPNKNYLKLKYTSSPYPEEHSAGTSMDTTINELSPINIPQHVALNVNIPYNQLGSLYRSPTNASVKSKFYTDQLSPLSSGSSNCKLNLVEKMKPFLKHVSATNLNDEAVRGYIDGVHSENDNNDSNISDILDSYYLNKAEKENVLKDEIKKNVAMLSDTDEKDRYKLDCSQDTSHLHTSTGTIIKNNEKVCKSFGDTIISNTDEECSGESNTNQVFLENDKETSSSTECILDVLTESQARHPIVLWHQNEKYIWIHIKLPSLSQYKFTCDVNSFQFRALYDQVPFMVNLQLFGGHKHEVVQYSAKAFHFEIRLEKILKGKKYDWPRLSEKDEKFHWLKVNVEKASEYIEDSEDDDIKQLACSLPHWNDDPQNSDSLSTDSSEENNSEISVSPF